MPSTLSARRNSPTTSGRRPAFPIERLLKAIATAVFYTHGDPQRWAVTAPASIVNTAVGRSIDLRSGASQPRDL